MKKVLLSDGSVGNIKTGKIIKNKRHKAGWKETDRLCRFCGKLIPVDKVLNKHHISYSQNLVVPLCYMCHNLVHGRIKYNCPYDKAYGADHGGFFRSMDIIRFYAAYPKVMQEIGEKISRGGKNDSK